jgi:signal transduction histidine kinase
MDYPMRIPIHTAPETAGPLGASQRPGRGALGFGRSGAGTALILLAFVMLPGAVLGYLSWRAIVRERASSLEQLRSSYRQFAVLAARQIDFQLRSLESRWMASFDGLMSTAPRGLTAEQVARATGKEPLIANYFLLAAPGRVLYPPMAASELDDSPQTSDLGTEASEHDEFAALAARGEELEYRSGDLKGALATYREILAHVGNPRLRAMAESYIGRVQLKAGDPEGALRTFRGLLRRYPNERDLNRMYLRFLAQYQIAVALEGQLRYREALDALLELNRDLLSRSDAITQAQYAYFSDLVQTQAPQILGRPDLQDRPAYVQAFRSLSEQNKKRISEKHFVHLLASEMGEMSFKRKRYLPRTQYLSARAEGDPFLLAYRALPDADRAYVTGILAAEIDLRELQRELFAALKNLNSETQGSVAILGTGGEVVIGAEAAKGTLMATQDLMPPFDSWQVAIYLGDVPTAMQRLDLRRTLWLWIVSLMLLSILFGGYWFILRARQQAYLSRAQTTFVSNVTHELRTPLTSIKMFAELLEIQMSEPAPPEYPRQAGQYLGLIRQESDRLSRLIDRVVHFSRMERRAEQYQFEPCEVGEVVGRSVESFRPHANANGFRLELEVEDGLPEVSLDADAISQVMLNLLTNAVQYSVNEKEIRVHVRRDGGGVAIAVSDRGIGIRPRDLQRVFDKFYSTWRRMDSRTQGGLGLGLTISREIARAHGGDIQVESEVGRGSTFVVYLPAHAAAEEASAAGERRRRTGNMHAFGRMGSRNG